MRETNNLFIIVNSGKDKAYNHYAAYAVAFMAKLSISLGYFDQGQLSRLRRLQN